MKKLVSLSIAFAFIYSISVSFSAGIATAPYYFNRTGAGGTSANCTGSGCHAANSGTLGLNLYMINIITGDTIKTTPLRYTPNTPYKIKVVGQSQLSGYPIFGYQFAGQKTDGTGAGTYFSTPGLQSNVVGFFEIIEPVQPRNTTGIRCVDSINWISPAKGSGHVTLFLTMLAANNNGFADGDITNNDTFSYDEGPTDINDISSLISASVTPNPAIDKITLSIENANKGLYSMTILNQFGMVIQKKQLNVAVDNFNCQMDITNFAPGIYYLYLNKSGSQQAIKFLKL